LDRVKRASNMEGVHSRNHTTKTTIERKLGETKIVKPEGWKMGDLLTERPKHVPSTSS